MIVDIAGKETAMDKALRDKGLANRKAVLGEDYVNKSMAAADSFNGVVTSPLIVRTAAAALEAVCA